MNTRRMFLAFLIAVFLIPFSGCIGDEKADPTGPVQVTETGNGVTVGKISLEPTLFKITGGVKREERVRETKLAGVVPFGSVTEYRFVWNFENVMPLGIDSNKGEVFYQVWLGTANSQGTVQYVNLKYSFSGYNTTLFDASEYKASYKGVTHFLLSVEASGDAIIEFPLVEIPEMAEPTGEWTNATLNPFAKAFGDVKLGTPANGKVNMTVRAFDLPPRDKAGYDAFLKTGEEVIFLGHMKLEASIGAFGVVKEIEESKLKDWSVIVTYEPEAKNENPSKLVVLTSKFKSK